MTITGDNPIRRPEDDALNRLVVAQSFVQHVLALDASEGTVVGVLGAWGSGKTSFINLTREDFEQAGIPMLDFNPWMFSGAEQLVQSFFVELAAQLRIRPELAEIGQNLEDYGEVFSGMAWLPLVGPWIERGRGAAKLLGKLLQRRKEGVSGRRKKLRGALAKISKPIVVVLDDIDRLSTPEIRDIFRLVRLTASFPNIVYIVAFDRERVEKALDEDRVPGRDYLEKILQLAFDLPAVAAQVLDHQVFASLDKCLEGIENPGQFDRERWPDIFTELIRPFIRNMRDVRRYTSAVRGTVQALDGQIALVDVLALEAVRIFLPDVFRRLQHTVDGLTTASGISYGVRDDPPHLKAQVDSLLTAAEGRGSVARSMVYRLFPAAQRHVGGSHYSEDFKAEWLRERRVAHENLLRLYLERVAGEDLKAYTEAEKAWTYMADRDEFNEYLRSLDLSRLQDVISALVIFENQFSREHVVPATIVLLNLLPELPLRSGTAFHFGPNIAVGRVVYRLMRLLNDPAAVAAAVRQVLPEITSLFAKMELIDSVGHRPNIGHALVSEADEVVLAREWREEVRSASVDDLASEIGLLRLLLLTKRQSDASESIVSIDASPVLTRAILRSAKSEVFSQSFGSRFVRRSPRLAWDQLIELYGDETILRERIETLREARLEDIDGILELADKYLGGWRPENYDSE